MTATAPRDTTIRLSNVTIAYERHAAVHHLQGSFAPGSLTAIAGPNGAGKSTLLKALMGELPLAAGTIDRGGLAISDFGYLPQAAEIDRSFPLSVADTVLLGAWRETGPFRSVSAETADKARRALATVGLEGFERRRIGTLSAGQFQRVLFARLLMQDAKIILLDEPFTAIDSRTSQDLLELIHRWHEDHRTVIAVLHDFEQIRANFPQTLLLAREVIAWGQTDVAMSGENLLRARAMAEHWDETSPLCAAEDKIVA
ncbi:metal ABC transporter ATP-binding protein [Methyloferula stellata]|uniref:metal ABC transporter ATP-binding protein n=1 Tax=Methyloferula stellata TaxID=876270 RepID=UPI00047C9367|nr:ABC transporter ATP-binding protein [Methyloferula stellata]